MALFLEKPMAASLEDARAILNLLPSSGGPSNAVGYMVAFYPTFVHAGKLIKENALGKISRYSASLYLGEVFKKEAGWRQNPRISGGGALSVVGSHLIYLLYSFFGTPVKVQSAVTHLFSEVEDEVQAMLEHPDKLTGEVSVSWSKPGYSEMGFHIIVDGELGSVEVTENTVTVTALDGNSAFPAGRTQLYLWDLPAPKLPGTFVDTGQQGYAAQDFDFVSSVGGAGKPRVTWRDAFEVQRIIDGIYRSAAEPGNWVKL